MEEIQQHLVPDGIVRIRLSNYGATIFDGISSRSAFKRAIKRGEIFVNGMVAGTGTLVNSGMDISWHQSDRTPAKGYSCKVEVLYEDDIMAIVNKPAGLVVSGNRFDTLENAFNGILQPSVQPDALKQFRAAHRLDKDTSGLLIVAKTSSSRLKLGEMLERREIDKMYLALVLGQTPEDGIIDTPIGGKNAESRFRRIELRPSLISGWLSLLELKAITGRNHQLRIHLSEMGYPILGDKLYGDPNFLLRGKGLFLFAQQLHFRHPISGEHVDIVLPVPRKFTRFLDGEERRYRKYSP